MFVLTTNIIKIHDDVFWDHSIASVIILNEARQFKFVNQQSLCRLESSFNPASFIRIGLSNEINLLRQPRFTDALHDSGDIVAGVEVVIASSEWVITPELINALLEPFFLYRNVMNQTELFEDFFNQNFLSRIYILIARIADNLLLGAYS